MKLTMKSVVLSGGLLFGLNVAGVAVAQANNDPTYLNYSQTPTEQLKQLSKNGDERATFHIATRTLKGMGQPADAVTAFNLYKSLADKGFLEAKLNVGRLYLQGKGTAQNVLESKKYLAPCAKAGDSRAYFMLAKIAEGTETSKEVTYQLYKSVATDSTLSYSLREIAQRKLSQLTSSLSKQQLGQAESALERWLTVDEE